MKYLLFFLLVLILAVLLTGRCSTGAVQIPPKYWTWMLTTEVAVPGIAAAGVLIASLPRSR